MPARAAAHRPDDRWVDRATGRPRPRQVRPPLDRAARIERRRREQHWRRLRRDLLEDGVMAVALAVLVITVTAGLGVVALLAVPATGVVLGSFVVQRGRRLG